MESVFNLMNHLINYPIIGSGDLMYPYDEAGQVYFDIRKLTIIIFYAEQCNGLYRFRCKQIPKSVYLSVLVISCKLNHDVL